MYKCVVSVEKSVVRVLSCAKVQENSCSPAPKYRKIVLSCAKVQENRVFRGGVPRVCEYFSQGGHADAQNRHTGHVLMIQFPTIAMTSRIHAVMRPARGARRPKTAPRWSQEALETAQAANRSEKKRGPKAIRSTISPGLVLGVFLVAS